MLEGVKYEKRRWLKAIRAAGLDLGEFTNPEIYMMRLFNKIDKSRDAVWNKVMNILNHHMAEGCISACAEDIKEAIEDARLEDLQPPKLPEEPPPSPFD